MIFNLFSQLMMIAASAILVSCTGTLPAQNHHESEKSMDKISDTDSSQLKILKFKELTANQNDSEFLKQADDYFFRLNFWQDVQVNSSTEFVSFVDRYHLALLNVDFSEKSKNSERLAKYKKLVDQLCQDDLSSCEIVNILKHSPKSTDVFVSLSETEQNLTKKYKYIFIALDSQNHIFSTRAVNAFAQNIKAYKLDLENNLKKSEPQKYNLIRQKINSVLNYILSLYQEGRVTIANADWISDLKLLNSMSETDAAISGQHLVYDPKASTASEKKELSATFQTEIVKNQESPGSFSIRKKWMDVFNPTILSRLSVEAMPLDEYFYVVDQIMTGRWTSRQAAAFAKSASLDSKKLSSMISNYLKFEISYMICLSQSELKGFRKELNGIEMAEIFLQSKKSLSRSMTEARTIPAKAQKLRSFYMELVDKNSPELELISSQIVQIEKTMKTAITYPVTIALLYDLAKSGVDSQTKIAITKFSGEGYPSFALFLKSFFLGSLIPIFDYTEDVIPLNSFEILESFEIAAKANWFSMLDIDIDQFLSILFEVLSKPKTARLQSDMDNLTQKYLPAEWSDLQRTAESVKSGKSNSKVLSLLDIAESPTLGSSIKKLMDSFDGNSASFIDGVEFKRYGFFAYSARSIDQLEWIRLDLFFTIQYFESLIQILKNDSKSDLKLIQAKIDQLKYQSKAYIQLYQQRTREFDSTFYTLVQRDRDVISKIIQLESMYWKKVYQEMKVLRSQKSPNQSAQGLVINYALPSGILYRSQIGSDFSTSYQFDFLLRVKSYLETGFNSVAPIDPQIHVEVSPALSKKEIYQNSPVYSVPFTENEEEFIQAGINSAKLVGRGTNIWWFSGSYLEILGFREASDSAALMYRMGPLVKKILGLENLYKLEDLINQPEKIIQFLSLPKNEKAALGLVGIKSRYRPEILRVIDPIMQANAQGRPTHDYYLKSLGGRWMGTFGRTDLWEDIQSGIHRGRPEELIPQRALGENLFKYQDQLKGNVFSAALKSTAIMVEKFKVDVEQDFKVVDQARDAIQKFQEQHPNGFQAEYVSGEVLSLDIYSRGTFENIRSNKLDFNKKTGGFYQLGLEK